MSNIQKAIAERRSCYTICDRSPVANERIREMIDLAVTHVPSSFNSQSTRTVLLLGDHHKKLWDITKEELRKIVPQETFQATEDKINGLRSGYGTILFYEDQSVVQGLQSSFPIYKDNFPVWSEHGSAMHQYALWLMLHEAGFGATLHHYNPVIDAAVAEEWSINPEWRMIAQMPFGTPTAEPKQKSFLPLEQRSIVFE